MGTLMFIIIVCLSLGLIYNNQDLKKHSKLIKELSNKGKNTENNVTEIYNIITGINLRNLQLTSMGIRSNKKVYGVSDFTADDRITIIEPEEITFYSTAFEQYPLKVNGSIDTGTERFKITKIRNRLGGVDLVCKLVGTKDK